MERMLDSHAHYYDRRFEGLEGGADALLGALFEGEVGYIVNVGTDPENSRTVIAEAARWQGMYAAVGIHPRDCHYIPDADAELAELRSLLENQEMRAKNKIVAIGEIGLDYHFLTYGEIPMDKEKEQYFFEKQMELARELDMPVIIHDREAHGDCFETVLKYPEVRGVFHSYSGSAEMAKELIKRGWYISFSGTLTFKNAAQVRKAALAVPRDRLLIETDCPYLAPHPMRGKMNHSGLLSYTLESLASLWECSVEDAAKQTFENANRLFGL